MNASARRLNPSQDDRFFYLFQQLAAKAADAARRFQSLVQDFGDLNVAVDEIRMLEHEADVLLLELQTRLNAARVTPLDREDIHHLGSRLDDIVDHTEATADRLLLFRVSASTIYLARFADTLVRCAVEVEGGVAALIGGDREALLRHCHVINEAENEADQILRDALADLFSGGTEALEVIKWKELYDFIESATDACEDVSDVLETIALKTA